MTILHLISTFPPLTETFILREIRQLRKTGLNVVIGELRPLHRNRAAEGFEDLNPIVSRARWFSLDLLRGLVFFVFRAPGKVLECLRLVLNSSNGPRYIVKMIYILLSSMRLAYRFRHEDIGLVRADFLHSQALAARFLMSLLGRPYVLAVYTVFVHYPQKVIEEIVGKASFLVADTCQVKEFLEGMGVASERIHLIRNGVSVSEFPRRSRQANHGIPIILGVGSLYPKKGFHILLAACALLDKNRVQFRCVIVGDGYERPRLTEQRKALGLDGSVEMLGYLSLAELRDWYYRATVFVMPSVISPIGETDGLPTVVIEALSSGLPVVGTDTGGIPEVIQDGVTGYLVPTNAPKQLADGIQVLLERPDLREKFGCEGRRLVEREFNLDRKIEALHELFVGHATSRLTRDISQTPVEAIH